MFPAFLERPCDSVHLGVIIRFDSACLAADTRLVAPDTLRTHRAPTLVSLFFIGGFSGSQCEGCFRGCSEFLGTRTKLGLGEFFGTLTLLLGIGRATVEGTFAGEEGIWELYKQVGLGGGPAPWDAVTGGLGNRA